MRRGARLAKIGLLWLLVSGGVMASDVAATTGDLTQKPGVAGCWSAVGLCSPGTALARARSVTVSPDGRSAYAASQGGSAVVVFDRAADGTLTQKPGTAGCISETGAGPCVDGTALDSARSVTVSPDGSSAYVASGSIGAVAVFDRAADGTLTQKAGAAACISDSGAGPCVDGTALGGAFEVTVSPDGRNAYVASNASGAVAVFDRAADGTLTQKAGTLGCISDTGAGPCGDGTGLGGALGVVISPDGKSGYVASFDSAAVAVFDRAADGTLTQNAGTAACISDTGAGPCVDGAALGGASSVTVSPDGRSVYVASQLSSAVAVFDRAADGTLTQKGGTAACISDTGAGPCADGTALDVAASVAVSPDGQSAYVASFDSDAVAVLDRAADGGLTQKPGTAGCISEIVLGTCDVGSALDGARWVTVSPDGRSAYAASVISGAVAVFDREPPPPGLSVEDLTTDEPAAGSSSRRIVRVSLTAPAPVDVTVDYATTDRSATAPGDYTATAGTLTIPAGRTGGPILVPINGDTLAEGDEQFTVTLSNPLNATIARAAATVTIRDSSPPDTIITSGPANGATVAAAPTFEFRAVTPIPWYVECNVTWMGQAATGFRRCSSPQTLVSPAPSQPGQVRFEVRAVDFRGNVDPTPAVRVIDYRPPRLDLSVVGMEITQGVQRRDCFRSDGCRFGIMVPDGHAREHGSNPPRKYQGLTLAGQCIRDANDRACPAAKQVIVRVYVTYRGDPALARGAIVRVFGFDSNGRPLGSQIQSWMPGDDRIAPAPPPRLRPCCATPTYDDRRDPAAAYTFSLPGDWSRHRSLRLRAVVSPARPDILDTLPVNDQLEVSDIQFARPTTVTIMPVKLKVRGVSPAPGSEYPAFEGAVKAFPTAFDIKPYQGELDANDAAEESGKDERRPVINLIQNWADQTPRDFGSGVYPYGLYRFGLGMTTAATDGGTDLYEDRPASYAPVAGWPLSVVAHELGHGLGLPHAGLRCGSNSDGEVGSAWPPDDEGRTAAFGLDTRTPWPYRIVGDTAPIGYVFSPAQVPGPAQWDVMSYCPGPPVRPANEAEAIHWLSIRNWDHLRNYHAPGDVLPARAAARRASLAVAAQRSVRALGVTAFIDDAGAVSIKGLTRVTMAPTPSLPGSPWHVVVRDAAGTVLSDTGVAATTVEHSTAPMLRAKVPAAGAASGPDRQGRRRRRRARTQRSQAASADPEPTPGSSRARTPDDRSLAGERRRRRRADGVGRLLGRRRPELEDDLHRSRQRPGDALHAPAQRLSERPAAGARQRRVRLRQRRSPDASCRPERPPPSGSSRPPRAARISADATLVAQGEAHDDAGRRLTGRRLTWRLGRRIVGRGQEISAVDLPAGRRRLRLTARDRAGRSATASVAVRVFPVTPQFIELKAPGAISRKARRIRLHVVTNITATLRIGDQRFHVTRRPRTISVRVRPGRRPLRLRPVLTAAGRRSRAMLVIERRA